MEVQSLLTDRHAGPCRGRRMLGRGRAHRDRGSDGAAGEGTAGIKRKPSGVMGSRAEKKSRAGRVVGRR